MSTHPSTYTRSEVAVAHLLAIFAMPCTCTPEGAGNALEGDCAPCVAEDGLFTRDGHSSVKESHLSKAREMVGRDHDSVNLVVTAVMTDTRPPDKPAKEHQ